MDALLIYKDSATKWIRITDPPPVYRETIDLGSRDPRMLDIKDLLMPFIPVQQQVLYEKRFYIINKPDRDGIVVYKESVHL